MDLSLYSAEIIAISTKKNKANDRGEWLIQRLHYLDPWHVEKAMGLDTSKVESVWWRQALRFAAMLTMFAMALLVLSFILIYYLIDQVL